MGIKTGYTDIDEKINGFENGDLIFVGANATTDRTVLTDNLIIQITQHAIPTLLFSLDKNKEQTLNDIKDILFTISRMKNKELADDRKVA